MINFPANKHFLRFYKRRRFPAGKDYTGAATARLSGMDKEPQAFAAAQQPEVVPEKLPPIQAATEKQPGALPAPMAPGKRVGYALVGLGHLTLEQLLPAFAQCACSRPVALVSGNAAKAARVAEQYGIAPSAVYNYDNYDTIKDNPEIDAVYIVLPNSMHEEYTVRAAQAGKHVLCEKPMAVSSAQAQNMIAASKQAQRKLMVAYRIQYDQRHRKIMEWARNRQHGKLKVIEMYNGQNNGGDLQQWRFNQSLSGGGALPDIGIYCLNTARFITGEEPVWVQGLTYSTPGDPRFTEVEETAFFQLRFPSGIWVNAGCAYGAHESRRYRCLAENGWFGMDPAFPYNGLQAEAARAEGEIAWRQQPFMPEKNQFAQEIDHMSLSILNNTTPYTPGEEGLQDQRIMEAIYESARTGHPVKLDAVDGTDVFRGEFQG